MPIQGMVRRSGASIGGHQRVDEFCDPGSEAADECTAAARLLHVGEKTGNEIVSQFVHVLFDEQLSGSP